MDLDAIGRYVESSFEGVTLAAASQDTGAPEVAWGDVFCMYLDDQFPFATIVTKDYTGFDEASHLNRAGVFRLNIGLSRETFESLFPDEDAENDYTELDRLIPHPVYGNNHWVCVLNPSEVTFEQLKPLLAEAYQCDSEASALAVKSVRPSMSHHHYSSFQTHYRDRVGGAAVAGARQHAEPENRGSADQRMPTA